MLELINKPLTPLFFELVEQSTDRIKLCSPLIRDEVAKRIYDKKETMVRIDVVTNFNVRNFQLSLSDIDAMERFSQNKDTIFYNSDLNANLYIFDNKFSIITTASLTPMALEKKMEYGIVFDDKDLVKQTVKDFFAFCSCENAGLINEDDIIAVKKILGNNSDPNNKETYNPIDVDKGLDLISEKTLTLNDAKLSNWQRIVVGAISAIDNEEFTLGDVYQFENYFKHKYPDNATIHSTIRRTLQELRDLGLVEFYGRGRYRKLWK